MGDAGRHARSGVAERPQLEPQREVGADTKTFASALKYALREDPDIVLIGELRDLETIESALRIAETGHLTFATLHTNSAAQTINRIIDIFPSGQQGQIRTQLSLVLEGIVCQSLLKRADGKGRVASLEILVPTPAIRIRVGRGMWSDGRDQVVSGSPPNA